MSVLLAAYSATEHFGGTFCALLTQLCASESTAGPGAGAVYGTTFSYRSVWQHWPPANFCYACLQLLQASLQKQMYPATDASVSFHVANHQLYSCDVVDIAGAE
jgi:hypothetical protein